MSPHHQSAGSYSERVYAEMGIATPAYLPEDRWRTSGLTAWVTQRPFTGPLDRMWSGWQKVSAWEGPAAYLTTRSTGFSLTAGMDPDPNQLQSFRTPRALKDSNQEEWFSPYGRVQSDQYYALMGNGYPQRQPSVLSRLVSRLRGT